jgi:hypothetical protein
MEQDLLVAATQARDSWMHATTIHSTSKDLSCAETTLRPGAISAQVDAECLDILKIGNTESRPFPDGQDSTPSSDTDSAAIDSTMLQVSPIHHLNFFRQPVYHKCATPPATTLAVLMSQRQGIADFDKSICKATLVCQAMCFLDPVAYWGPHETLKELRGTALKESVTGQCAKLYTTDGIWRDDLWYEDEDEPFSYNDTANTDVLFDGERSYGLAPSEQDYINRLHCTEGSHDAVKKYTSKKERFLRQPCSRLREVACASDDD